MTKPARHIRILFKRSALFKALPPRALARIAQSVKTLNLRRGARIYAGSERSAGVYIIVSGHVMLSVGAPPDAVKVIDLLEAGGHFGLAAAILDAPQAVTAETLTDCTLLLVPRAALLAQLPEHAEFSLQLALALSRENAALIDDIEAHALRSGRQRVAGYLLHVCSGAKSRPFPLPARKSVIASRLGLTPEYFSRMLHELIVAGAIRVAGRHITILDAARMRDTGGAAAHG